MMLQLLLKVMERVCEIPTLNTPSPVANLFCLAIPHPKFPPSNLRIGGRTCTNHTVPYGPGLWGGAVPGTSCQATIILSLWEDRFRSEALIKLALLSRRGLRYKPWVDLRMTKCDSIRSVTVDLPRYSVREIEHQHFFNAPEPRYGTRENH
ncbi:MAG: hypothetical protein QOG92_1607 [Verrucomicrobiota bacterium]|nr:hypothetical protein [Verrucomicrobiota bacterium]